MIERLKERFEQNPRRHQGICWAEIQPRLTEEKLLILQRMEETGGEPDVIGRDGDRILYADCAAETPAGRAAGVKNRGAAVKQLSFFIFR